MRSLRLACLAAGALAVVAVPSPSLASRDGAVPRLTPAMLDRYSAFLEWLLDVPLVGADRHRVEQAVARDYPVNPRGLLDVLELEAALRRKSAQERTAIRAELLPEVLAALRGDAHDPDSRWLLAQYERGHEVLARGGPALTRAMADAYLDMIAFIIGEAAREPVELTEPQRAEAERSLAAQWPSMTPQQKAPIVDARRTLAALRVGWARASEQERDRLRVAWAAALRPAPEKREAAPAKQRRSQDEQIVALEKAQRRNESYRIMSDAMRMNHETNMAIISNMGSGYRYEYRYR
jgi:hypothetical protein